ncbi:MAG: glycosyltransferase family 4 protein [Pirellulales bacterium]
MLPLAKRHRITYIAYRHADPDETRQAVAFLNDHGIETMVVDRLVPCASGLAFYARLLLNLLSPLPYSVQVHNSGALRHAIRRHAATHRVDLWHAEWTPYHEPICRTVPGPWVVMAHNVESLIWQRYCETESNVVKRWYIKRQWHKFERFERRAFSRAAQTVTVSDADAALARERFGAVRVSVVDNGVDVAAFRTDGSPRNPHRVLFLGSLDWRPNLDAVQILLDRVFPEVLAKHPAAQLVLVGRKPPGWLTDRVRECRNVQLHADVPDVRPFLWECGMMVVPLRIGGGSRLKIIEALAAECPVVSTRVGAEGLHLIPNRHFVQVDGIDEVAPALVQGIANPRPLQEMAILGRQLVADRYDWPMLSTKLETVWHAQARPQAGPLA